MDSELGSSATVGAGPVTAALMMVIVSGPAVAQHFSAWSAAVPVVEVNSPFNDGCPMEAPDGRRLYIASNRPGTLGGNDVWVSTWTASGWGEPANLGPPVNSAASDYCPTPLHGRWLFFVSERPRPDTCAAGPGSGDIYVVRHNPARGWGTPEHLPCAADGGPNTTGPEFSPSIVETAAGTFLYYSTNGSDGTQDIFVSQMDEQGRFGVGQPVPELSTPYDDRMPNVRKDGLEIVFSSSRPTWGGGMPAFGSQDVYSARRDRVDQPWPDPVNLGPAINTSGAETRASFSWDARRLYFGRDGDVQVSQRSRVHPD